MKNYLEGWNVMRLLRLILGIIIIVQGIQGNDWSFILLGSLFSLMPIFNVGCCGASGCNTSYVNTNKNIKEVTYEEVR